MKSPKRYELELRWKQIAEELAEIERYRIVPRERAVSDREGALLEEQDAIEYQVGMLYFEERDGKSD